MKQVGGKKLGVVVSARMSSSRLPNKVMKPVQGMPLILFLLNRLRGIQSNFPIIIATSVEKTDDVLAEFLKKNGFIVFRGKLDNLVERHLELASSFELDWIVRVTGDCPWVSSETLSHCLEQFFTNPGFDLYTTKGQFPVGIDYEIFKVASLKEEYGAAKFTAEEKEHLTLYFYQHLHERIFKLIPKVEWGKTMAIFTVDYPADYEKLVSFVSENPEVINISTSELYKKYSV